MSRLCVNVPRGTASLLLLLLCTLVLLCCTAAGTAAPALQLSCRDHTVANISNNTSHDTVRCVQTRYIVVFDFGSSGNRAHVYRFTQPQHAKAATAATTATAAKTATTTSHTTTMTLPQQHADKDVYAALLSQLHGVDVVEELYIHDTSPLHTAATPAAAVTAVQLLLYRVMAHIPSSLHSDTLVAYCATAGLRLAKQQQQPQARRDGGDGVVVSADVLLQALHEQLSQSTTLRVTRDARGRAVQLLDGDEEAALAWLAVNFAHVRAATMTTTTVTTNILHRQHKNNNSSSSAAIIDLGGGSTQVGVLLPRHGSDADDDNDNAVTTPTVTTAADATTSPSASSLFARSHDGLGLHAAVRALLRHARDTPSLTHHFPCFAVGVIDAVSGVQRRHNNKDSSDGVAHTHGADFDACVVLFRTHVLHTLYTPCDDVKHNDSHTTTRTARHVNTSNSSSSSSSSDDVDDDDVHAVSCASTRMRELRRRLASAHNVSVFAFSYVYDVLHSDEQQQQQQPQTRQQQGQGDSVVSVWRMADVAAAGAAQCRGLGKHTAAATAAATAGSWRHEYTCMYYAYVYALLHHGYGLPASRRIHVASKLGGLETTWALGAALRLFARATTTV